MKTCSFCNVEKPLSEFSIRKDRNKPDSYCKACRSDYYKKKAYDRKTYQSQYKRKATKDRQEYINAFKRKKGYRYVDKEARAIYDLVRRVLNYKSEKKSATRNELLGWSKKEFLAVVGMMNKGTHLDHKIPMSWFKTDAPCHIVNHLSNLQILTADQNLKKNNKYHDVVSSELLELVKPHIKEEYRSVLYTC